MRRLLVGLTGGIGAGKSTVARELSRLGAEIVSGDELGRRALDETPGLIAKIRERFGAGIFSSEGTLNRRVLGERVFSDLAHVRWLTDRTFPEIHRRWIQAASESSRSVIVFDAALIFEWGIQNEFDLMIVVTAPSERIRVRLQKEERLLPPEIESRSAAQIAPEVKAAHAHIHLKNEHSIETLTESVREIWRTRILPALENKENNRE